MPQPFPETYQTFDALTVADDGATVLLKATPLPDAPGFDGYLVPWYTLSDRGSFFVPGALKKTAKERVTHAPHLWQHNLWTDEIPIGRHTSAVEDDKGFRISVAMNEGVPKGAEVMNALRFGSDLGLSIGFDPIRDRSGTEEDDAKLDRRTAPDYFKNIPINELRAITEVRWWESSSVVFGAIATAKPDEIRARSGASPDALTTLLAAIRTGHLTEDQYAQIVDAWTKRAAAGSDHGTRDSHGRRSLSIEMDVREILHDLADLVGEAA